MNFLSFNISSNHIFFFLIFITYFIKELFDEYINTLFSDEDQMKYQFGKTKSSTKKLFNMYVYTISNLLSIFAVCIINFRSKRKYFKSREIKDDNSSSSKKIRYIYNDIPIKIGKLLKRTLTFTVCDFIAQFIVFILYFTINDDSKFKIIKLDVLFIFNILARYLFSKILLKSRFYKHHYLALGINIFCLIILAIIEFIKNDMNLYFMIYLFIRIISQLFYSLEDVVGKMALIDEFLSPYTLLVYKGIYEIILLLVFSIPFFFIERDGEIIFSKMIFFVDSFLKCFMYFIAMILNFIYVVFIWIIIDRFSPNDFSMSTVIEGLTNKLLKFFFKNDYETGEFIYECVIYILLAIGICIFSEIIVINKCGLNENTKENFGNKGYEDYELTKNPQRFSIDSLDGKLIDDDILERSFTAEYGKERNKPNENSDSKNRAKSFSMEDLQSKINDE